MKYIYGPVKSRRLGLSLGVSLTPYKICSFDCVYSQLGQTTHLTAERKVYVNTEEILNELKSWLEYNSSLAEELNYVTISGSGEPSLNTQVGALIGQIKRLVRVPVALITNSSLLVDAAVRQSLGELDLIVPSLDAVSQEIFAKIDRPYKDIKIEDIIQGLIELRKGFKGKIWLEIMLVKGVNDDLRQIKKMKEVVEQINPDKIQLNSPVRATAQPDVLPVEKSKLGKIKEILGDKCEIV